MKTLFTAFGAFPGVPINPTELLISKWQTSPDRRPDRSCECTVLPTEFRRSEETIHKLLDRYDPRILIMTGVKQSEATISLERYALNIDDCTTPDADGNVRDGTEIRVGAAPALTTSVDLLGLRNALRARGYGVEVSNHAGTYVCNHAYFTALDLVQSQRRSTEVLFVHVPMHPLVARRDIFESGSLQYLESALHDIWRHLAQRVNSERGGS